MWFAVLYLQYSSDVVPRTMCGSDHDSLSPRRSRESSPVPTTAHLLAARSLHLFCTHRLSGSPLSVFAEMSVRFLNVISLHINGHFPAGPGLAGTRMSAFWILLELRVMGGGGNNWSCKVCKAPVKMSPPTNQHPVFYRPDALPVAKPTVSKH